MTTLKLIGMPQSPWTLKALWALDVCGVDYAFENYVPPLHAHLLRLRTGRLRGPLSVPVLLGAERPVWGTLQIASFADQRAAQTGATRLGDLEVITPWSALSEAALSEGRTRVTRAYLDDPSALDELMPSFIPRSMHKSMRWLVRDTLRRIERKYAHLVTEGALAKALAAMRLQLATHGGPFLLGEFSYADIAMAVVLEGVEPRAGASTSRSARGRPIWPELAAAHRDLLDWRDGLIAKTDPLSLRPGS